MSPVTLPEYLRLARVAIDEALARFLPSPPDCPAVVCDAMRYSVEAGGKRLRPILTIAAAEATAARLGADPAEARAAAMPAACAVELVHTYSLVHDDLPAMDNDELRRGRPTAHVVFGEGLAILAGDALLTEAFGVLARPHGHEAHAERAVRAIHVLAQAAGAAGMVGGQAIDLQASGLLRSVHESSRGFGAAELRDMHARKTGALIRAAAVMGAIAADAPADVEHAIDRYATELGLAFQIVDDVLDVEGATAEIGKTPGKDAAAGKPTYPALFGLDTSKRLARECVDRAHVILQEARLGGQLGAIADWVARRSA